MQTKMTYELRKWIKQYHIKEIQAIEKGIRKEFLKKQDWSNYTDQIKKTVYEYCTIAYLGPRSDALYKEKQQST